MSLPQKIINSSEWTQPPYLENDLVVCGQELPPEYLKILNISNGLLSKRGLIRIFGTAAGPLPSIFDWNAAEWKREYGRLTDGLVVVAEDVFGDQYGYRFGDRECKFGKFYCEGGQFDSLDRAI